MKQNYPHFPISSRFSEFSGQPAAFLSTTTSAKHLFDFSFCFYKSSAEVLLWMKHAIRNLENHLPVAPSWMDWLAPPWLCTWRQQGLYVPIYSCPLCVGPTQPHKDTAIFLHSESWFDVSSTERSFPSNHSSVNRPRSEAPQNNNNNNNNDDDDDDENNSPARRRLLCPHPGGSGLQRTARSWTRTCSQEWCC